MNKKFAKYLYVVACCLGLLLGFTGCKTAQMGGRSLPANKAFKDSIAWAQNYHSDWTHLQAKYTLGFTGNQILNLKGEFKSVFNQELLINLRALFGWEILQLYCTPKEAVIVDKVRKQYCSLPFSELAPELGVDFYGLQALLTQGMFDPSQRSFQDFKVKKEGENLVFTHNGKYLTEFLWNSAQILQRTRIESYQDGSALLVHYLEPKVVDGYLWANQMQVIFSSKTKNQSVNFKFSQIKINQMFSLGWKVPTSYRAIPFENIKREINAL